MKPKHPFHHLQLALLGMPFLLLSVAVHAQDQPKDQKAAEVAKTEQTDDEKGNAKRAKEVAERAKDAAEVAKTKQIEEEQGTARRAKEVAERASKAAEGAKEAAKAAEIRKAAEEMRNASRAKQAAAEAEAAATRKAEVEKGNARRSKEVAERARKAAQPAKQAPEEEKPADAPKQMTPLPAAPAKVPEPAPLPATDKPEEPAKPAADPKPDSPARGQRRSEPAPGTKNPSGKRPTRESSEVREARQRPATPVTPVAPVAPAPPPAPPVAPAPPPAPPATPLAPARPQAPPADAKMPPVDMPVVPAEPLKPREGMKPRGNDTVPAKDAPPEVAPAKPEDRKTADIPATEPERLAESKVAEATREVQRDLDQRKTRIEGRTEAQALINEILGAKSRISRAEVAREERFRPRLERQRPGEQQRLPEASPDQRRAATTYFQQRLRGREVDGPPPEFFGRSQHRGDRLDPRVQERGDERVEFVRPRYLNEGRRYVHFDSRAAIPAILMAAQAMNLVRFQPTREIAPLFPERQEGSATQAMPLPPENYRNENSWVVSYPVDEKSMISSEDILFLQGSTQFSDPYSYEVIAVMADAMKELPEEDRFVIEGHASAEGSYESNMVLSQQRAEHIVREIVRRGVSPYRLLPVGYGESEARRSAESAEALRSQDRRVVVFRMKPEPVAKR